MLKRVSACSVDFFFTGFTAWASFSRIQNQMFPSTFEDDVCHGAAATGCIRQALFLYIVYYYLVHTVPAAILIAVIIFDLE